MKKSIFKKQPSPIPRYVPTNEYFRRIVAISGAPLTMLALCETDSQTAKNRMFLALQNTEIAKARAMCRALMINQERNIP